MNKKNKTVVVRFQNIKSLNKIAKLLSEGKVIGWFQGLEWNLDLGAWK